MQSEVTHTAVIKVQ